MRVTDEGRQGVGGDSGSVPQCETCSSRMKCLIQRVSPAAAKMLMPHIIERVVPPGVIVERQDVVASHLGMIKLGLLKADRQSTSGERAAVCVVGRGRISGFASLFKQPSAVSLTALTPTRVCQIPISVMYDHAFVEREFRQYLYAAVGGHIENMAEWCGLVRERNISKRLMAAFELMAQEEGSRTLRIPTHSALGELIVVRRESVARHIAQLLRVGRLRKVDRWRVMLTQAPDELNRLGVKKVQQGFETGAEE